MEQQKNLRLCNKLIKNIKSDDEDHEIIVCHVANLFSSNINGILKSFHKWQSSTDRRTELLFLLKSLIKNLVGIKKYVTVDISSFINHVTSSYFDVLFLSSSKVCKDEKEYLLEFIKDLAVYDQHAPLDVLLQCKSLMCPALRMIKMYIPSIRYIANTMRKNCKDDIHYFVKLLLVYKLVCIEHSKQANENGGKKQLTRLKEELKRCLVVPKKFAAWAEAHLGLADADVDSLRSVFKRVDSSVALKILYPENQVSGERVTESLSNEGYSNSDKLPRDDTSSSPKVKKKRLKIPSGSEKSRLGRASNCPESPETAPPCNTVTYKSPRNLFNETPVCDIYTEEYLPIVNKCEKTKRRNDDNSNNRNGDKKAEMHILNHDNDRNVEKSHFSSALVNEPSKKKKNKSEKAESSSLAECSSLVAPISNAFEKVSEDESAQKRSKAKRKANYVDQTESETSKPTKLSKSTKKLSRIKDSIHGNGFEGDFLPATIKKSEKESKTDSLTNDTSEPALVYHSTSMEQLLNSKQSQITNSTTTKKKKKKGLATLIEQTELESNIDEEMTVTNLSIKKKQSLVNNESNDKSNKLIDKLNKKAINSSKNDLKFSLKNTDKDCGSDGAKENRSGDFIEEASSGKSANIGKKCDAESPDFAEDQPSDHIIKKKKMKKMAKVVGNKHEKGLIAETREDTLLPFEKKHEVISRSKIAELDSIAPLNPYKKSIKVVNDDSDSSVENKPAKKSLKRKHKSADKNLKTEQPLVENGIDSELKIQEVYQASEIQINDDGLTSSKKLKKKKSMKSQIAEKEDHLPMHSADKEKSVVYNKVDKLKLTSSLKSDIRVDINNVDSDSSVDTQPSKKHKIKRRKRDKNSYLNSSKSEINDPSVGNGKASKDYESATDKTGSNNEIVSTSIAFAIKSHSDGFESSYDRTNGKEISKKILSNEQRSIDDKTKPSTERQEVARSSEITELNSISPLIPGADFDSSVEAKPATKELVRKDKVSVSCENTPKPEHNFQSVEMVAASTEVSADKQEHSDVEIIAEPSETDSKIPGPFSEEDQEDLAPGSEEDMIPVDDTKEMFTELEDIQYHKKVMDELRDQKVARILSQVAEQVTTINQNEKTAVGEKFDLVSIDDEGEPDETDIKLEYESADDDPEELEVIYQTIRQDTRQSCDDEIRVIKNEKSPFSRNDDDTSDKENQNLNENINNLTSGLTSNTDHFSIVEVDKVDEAMHSASHILGARKPSLSNVLKANDCNRSGLLNIDGKHENMKPRNNPTNNSDAEERREPKIDGCESDIEILDKTKSPTKNETKSTAGDAAYDVQSLVVEIEPNPVAKIFAIRKDETAGTKSTADKVEAKEAEAREEDGEKTFLDETPSKADFSGFHDEFFTPADDSLLEVSNSLISTQEGISKKVINKKIQNVISRNNKCSIEEFSTPGREIVAENDNVFEEITQNSSTSAEKLSANKQISPVNRASPGVDTNEHYISTEKIVSLDSLRQENTPQKNVIASTDENVDESPLVGTETPKISSPCEITMDEMNAQKDSHIHIDNQTYHKIESKPNSDSHSLSFQNSTQASEEKLSKPGINDCDQSLCGATSIVNTSLNVSTKDGNSSPIISDCISIDDCNKTATTIETTNIDESTIEHSSPFIKLKDKSILEHPSTPIKLNDNHTDSFKKALNFDTELEFQFLDTGSTSPGRSDVNTQRSVTDNCDSNVNRKVETKTTSISPDHKYTPRKSKSPKENESSSSGKKSDVGGQTPLKVANATLIREIVISPSVSDDEYTAAPNSFGGTPISVHSIEMISEDGGDTDVPKDHLEHVFNQSLSTTLSPSSSSILGSNKLLQQQEEEEEQLSEEYLSNVSLNASTQGDIGSDSQSSLLSNQKSRSEDDIRLRKTPKKGHQASTRSTSRSPMKMDKTVDSNLKVVAENVFPSLYSKRKSLDSAKITLPQPLVRRSYSPRKTGANKAPSRRSLDAPSILNWPFDASGESSESEGDTPWKKIIFKSRKKKSKKTSKTASNDIPCFPKNGTQLQKFRSYTKADECGSDTDVSMLTHPSLPTLPPRSPLEDDVRSSLSPSPTPPPPPRRYNLRRSVAAAAAAPHRSVSPELLASPTAKSAVDAPVPSNSSSTAVDSATAPSRTRSAPKKERAPRSTQQSHASESAGQIESPKSEEKPPPTPSASKNSEPSELFESLPSTSATAASADGAIASVSGTPSKQRRSVAVGNLTPVRRSMRLRGLKQPENN